MRLRGSYSIKYYKNTELHSNLRHSSLLSSWWQMHQASTSPTHCMQNIISIIQRIIHTRIYWIIKSVLWRSISLITTCKTSTSRLSRVSRTKWYTDWSIIGIIKYRLWKSTTSSLPKRWCPLNGGIPVEWVVKFMPLSSGAVIWSPVIVGSWW